MPKKKQEAAGGSGSLCPLTLEAAGVVRDSAGRDVAFATNGEDTYGALARMVRCTNALAGYTDEQVERREFMHGNVTVNGKVKGHGNQIVGGVDIRAKS